MEGDFGFDKRQDSRITEDGGVSTYAIARPPQGEGDRLAYLEFRHKMIEWTKTHGRPPTEQEQLREVAGRSRASDGLLKMIDGNKVGLYEDTTLHMLELDQDRLENKGMFGRVDAMKKEAKAVTPDTAPSKSAKADGKPPAQEQKGMAPAEQVLASAVQPSLGGMILALIGLLTGKKIESAIDERPLGQHPTPVDAGVAPKGVVEPSINATRQAVHHLAMKAGILPSKIMIGTPTHQGPASGPSAMPIDGGVVPKGVGEPSINSVRQAVYHLAMKAGILPSSVKGGAQSSGAQSSEAAGDISAAQAKAIEQKLHHRPEGMTPPADATDHPAQPGGKIGQQTHR